MDSVPFLFVHKKLKDEGFPNIPSNSRAKDYIFFPYKVILLSCIKLLSIA